MSELRFDGRVAIVTGAGGNPSMGRAHALLLASRGARVVVNDIGKVKEVPGYAGSASADAVVAEIREAGGEAVADTNDISSEAGANALGLRTASAGRIPTDKGYRFFVNTLLRYQPPGTARDRRVAAHSWSRGPATRRRWSRPPRSSSRA